MVNLSIMSNGLITLFVAAAAAAGAYSKLGKRVGYGNSRNVWIITGIAFVLVFIFVYTLLTYVLNFHNR